jgi:uncharacterized protein with ParB-like and HNH nuclease domain
MRQAKIQGKENTIMKIFSEDYVFSIPYYQRPYSWTHEEALALLQDLLDAIGEEKDNPDNINPYFLGSIVLIKSENNPEAKIIDGQQRLVTLTILFSAIRYLVNGEKSKEISDLIYEKGSSIRGTTDRYRLTVREKDNDFFRKYIQDGTHIEEIYNLRNLTDSCENMRQNMIKLIDKLKELTEEQRCLLAYYITTSCFLVVVSTPDIYSAYRIFSVLNDRGQELSLTDILKADIVGTISEKDKNKENEYTAKWEDIEDQLGRDGFSELFAHIRMIYAKRKLRKTLLEELRAFVEPAKNPKSFIDNDLIPYGEEFDRVKNLNIEGTDYDNQINEYLEYLNRIDNFDWIPPLIYFLTKSNRSGYEILRFMEKLERLSSVLMIIRADINYRVDRYGRLIDVIKKNTDLYDANSPLELSSLEQREAINQLNGSLFNVVKIRLPVLLRLDEALSSGGAQYNYNIISVEHVLPQNPPENSQWLQWWTDEEERENWVHCLGNLVLLSRRKNSQARNYDFETKKDKYFKKKGVSPFALTTEVLNEDKWTPDTVKKRQKRLVETLKNVWNLHYPLIRTK